MTQQYIKISGQCPHSIEFQLKAHVVFTYKFWKTKKKKKKGDQNDLDSSGNQPYKEHASLCWRISDSLIFYKIVHDYKKLNYISDSLTF